MNVRLLGAGLAGGLLAACLIAPAQAQPTQPTPRRLSGQVVSVEGDTLTLDSDGARLPIRLTPNLTVQISVKTTLDAIKPGSFVGTTNVDIPGGGRATEVHVFPPGSRLGEGQRLMDPESSTRMTNGAVQSVEPASPTRMTNGGVDQVRQAGSGLEMVVTFPGGVRTVQVPPGATLSQLTPADRSLLKPGALVTVYAASGPDGRLAAGYISTGPGGSAPAL